MAENNLTSLEAALRSLVDDLRASCASFALVGGLAVSARAEPRLTRDADIAVSVRDDQHAEAVVRDLIEYGYRPGAVLEQYVAGRLATVRLVHRSRPDAVIDLLFASSGIEPEIVEQAEAIEVLPGLIVPVAKTGHLIAMKLLARDDRHRPADADDLNALSAIATADDWTLARNAVELIIQRGFHRNRDLVAALASLTKGEP